MRVDEFDFHLPEANIALEPARPRDSARLLHVNGMKTADHIVRDLPGLLRAGDLLVANNTKVIPAQLTGVRPARAHGGGGDVIIDITLHKDETANHNQGNATVWKAFVRPAKRLKEGDALDFGEGVLTATVMQRQDAEALLAFDCLPKDFMAKLMQVGMMPLPPYIARKRAVTQSDREDYQTRYAAIEGSVAAPTAGLHFTPDLMAKLADAGIGFETITLHVGAGTFLPVSVDDTNDHKMHAEWGEITAAQAERINETRRKGERVIAVGTTSLRLLESAATPDNIVHQYCDETDIFITPGYEFRAVDALMTNFHLPRSTLFMLVSAFAGTQAMKAAYAHAIETGYRFYSYGDSSLLERA